MRTEEQIKKKMADIDKLSDRIIDREPHKDDPSGIKQLIALKSLHGMKVILEWVLEEYETGETLLSYEEK